MEIAFAIAAIVTGLIGLGCNIVILVHAFKSSVGEGFLCLCVPCYILYSMFSTFEHPHKGLIILGSLGGSIVSNVLARLAQPSAPSYAPVFVDPSQGQ
jgi:hypothetical protein